MLKAVTCDALHCCGNSTRAASAALHAGYLLCVYLRPVSHAVRAHAGVDTITRDAPRHWLRTLRTPWRRTAPERAARLEGAASALATAQGRRAGEAVGSTALAVLRMQLQPPPQASLLLHRGHGVRKHQAQRTVLPDGRAYLSCDHARPTPRPDLPDADACGGEGSYSAGESE